MPLSGQPARHARGRAAAGLPMMRGDPEAVHGLGGGKTAIKRIEKVSSVGDWHALNDQDLLDKAAKLYHALAKLTNYGKMPGPDREAALNQVAEEAIARTLHEAGATPSSWSSSSSSSSSPAPARSGKEEAEEGLTEYNILDPSQSLEKVSATMRRLAPGKASVRGPLARMADASERRRTDIKEVLDTMRKKEEIAEAIAAATGKAPGDVAPTKVGLVIEKLPVPAQRFVTSMTTQWPTVFELNPSWVAKIERDLLAAHLYPPRGASSHYLATVIQDIAEMLDKEQARLENPSRSSLRLHARRKTGRRAANPLVEYGGEEPYGVSGMTEFIHQGAQQSGGSPADPYDAPGPDVETTAFNPPGTVTIGDGHELPTPQFSYATPEQRLQQQEVLHGRHQQHRKAKAHQAGHAPNRLAKGHGGALGGLSGRSGGSASGKRVSRAFGGIC